MADEIKVPISPEIDEKALEKAEDTLKTFVYNILERDWTSKKTGRSGKTPVISSDRFTGMVNAQGNGYVLPGQTLSARDIMQMWKNNNLGRDGQEARTILQSFLNQLKRDVRELEVADWNKGREYTGPGADKLKEMGTSTTWKYPVYGKESELRSWFTKTLAKYFEIPKNLEKDLLGNLSVPTTNDWVADVKVELDNAQKRVFNRLNADLKTGIRNITEGIFSEVGDMNSRSTAEIEAQKKRQSDEDVKYAGWQEPDDEEYSSRLTRKYENEARRAGFDIESFASLKDWAQKIRERRESIPDESNDLNVESINNDIKTIVRFLTEGQLLDTMPEITQSFNEDQTSIFESLKMLSNYLDSVPDISKYLTFEPKTKGEQEILGQDLPQFLEQLSDVLVSFVDSQGNKLDTRVESRIKNSIVSINKILGTLDYARQQTGDNNLGFTDKTIQTFWNQLQEHVPFGGKRTYDADAVRSLTSKMGLPTEGNFPVAKVGQHLTGSLPFFPNKDFNGLLDTLNEWLFKYKKAVTQEDLYFSVTGTSDEESVKEFMLSLENIKKIIDGMEGSERQQGLSALRDTGLEQTASGEIKSIGSFNETDIDDVVNFVKNNASDLTGDSLREQMQRLQNIRAEVTSKAMRNLEEEKKENEREIQAIANILMDFQQSDFTMDELKDIVFFDESGDYEDINLDEIRFTPQADGSKLVTRENLQDRIKTLENITETRFVQQDKEIVDALGILEKRYIEEKLEPYLRQYANASTVSEKSQITKQVKADFSKVEGGDKVIEQWSKDKKKMLQNIQKKLDEEKEQKLIEDLEQAWKERQEQEKKRVEILSQQIEKESKNASPYIETLTTQYEGSNKTYTGHGLIFEGQPTFVTDIKKEFQNATEERKQQLIKELQSVYDRLNESEKEWLLAELQKSVSWNNIELSGLWDSFKGYEGISSNILSESQKLKWNPKDFKFEKQDIQAESDTFDNLNKTAGTEHVQAMENASNAEQGKILVSEKLQKQLEQEQDALESVQNQAEQDSVGSGRFGHVTDMSGFKPNFESSTHGYSDPETGEKFYSVTQLRDALIRGKNPAFGVDLTNIQKKAQEKFDAGLDAVSVDDFEGMSEKDFKFMVEDVIGQGLRGDVFHSLIDKMVKNDVQTMEELAEKAPDTYNDWQKEYQDAVAELKKYGIDEAFLGIDERLEAYMDAMRKSGLSATEFSEQKLAFTMKGSRGNIKVGVTPDQLYSMNGTGAFVDTKTGSVKGMEAFQLTAQYFATMLNLDTELKDAEGNVKKLRDMIGDVDTEKPMKAYIADVQDGMTVLTEYLYLSADEFYNLAMDAQEIIKGNREPLTKEEQRTRMNRQLKTGNIIGMSQNYIDNTLASGEFGEFGNNVQSKAIRDFLKYYQQIKKLETEITDLKQQGNTASEQELKNIQESIKKRQNQIDILKNNMPTLRHNTETGGAIIDNTILSPEMNELFNRKTQEIDAGIDVRTADKYRRTSNKNAKDINKEQLSIIRDYTEEYKRLVDLENELYELEQKRGLEAINNPESDKLSQLDSKIEATKILIEGQTQSLNNYGFTYDENTGLFGFTDANINLSIENANKLNDNLEAIEKSGLNAREKLQDSYSSKRQSAEKKLNSNLISLIKERNNTQLELEKINTKELANPDLENDKDFQQYKQFLQNLIDDRQKAIDKLLKQAEEFEIALDTSLINTINSKSQVGINEEKNKQSQIEYMRSGVSDKEVSSYLAYRKQELKIQEQIYALEKKMETESGTQRQNSEAYKNTLQEQLKIIRQQIPLFDSQNQTLNGRTLNEEQITNLLKQQSILYANHNSQIAKINASQKQQRNIFQEITGGFKQAFSNLTDASLAYEAIGLIKRSISDLINTTKELDAALVDIQIATGETRQETHALMLSYNDLADELGRTTSDVAIAANDWLRAGYMGQEAAELTRASMQLSTLGMINSADATSYLISVLKGWKIEASDVTKVVDKLTAVDMSAAISAGDLAEAMSRANNSAQQAGVSLNNYMGMLTTVADVTQRSPETVGEAFKTLFSRIGNVKAGKFVATQEDMASEDYNEEVYDSLNDVETVLDAIGIKLRQNVNTYRETEDVLKDIADIWKTLSDTEQGAVANALGGTRQREIVLTMFENWESVENFANIAENAYGTAEQKMEAFTDSVEAAQNRLTSAIEQWALELNGSGMIKTFYNSLSFAVENIDAFAFALGSILVISNLSKVVGVLTSAFTKLSSKVVQASSFIGNSGVSDTGMPQGAWQNFVGSMKQSMNSAFVAEQQKLYGARLSAYTQKLTELEKNSLLNVQNIALNNDALEKQRIAIVLTSQNEEAMRKALENNILEENKQALVSAMLTSVSNEELVVLRERTRKELEAALQTDKVTDEQIDLVIASRLYTSKLKEASAKVGENVRASSQTSVGKSLRNGAITMGAGIASSFGLGTLGTKLFGDTGGILGSMIGGSVTTNLVSKLLSGGLSGLTTGGKLGLVGAAIGTITGAVWGLVDAIKEANLQKAVDNFNEMSTTLENMQNVSTDVSKYDELAQGVDRLGNNVSLTDEEYQDFLDISNSLAEVYPSLIVGQDEFGNKLIGTAGAVGQVSDAIEVLIEQQKHLTNEALLNDTLLKENFKTAKDQYQDAAKSQEENQKLVDLINNAEVGDNSFLIGRRPTTEKLLRDLRDLGIQADETTGRTYNQYGIDFNIENEEQLEQIRSLTLQYQNEIYSAQNTMSEATASMIDEINAVWEEMEYGAYGDYYKDMLEGMDETTSGFIKNALGSMSLDSDSNDFEQVVKDTVRTLNQAFSDNPDIMTLYYQWQEADTQGEANNIRKQLMDALKTAFGDDFDETEMQILTSLNFLVDENGNLIDELNYYQRIISSLGIDSLSNITEEQFSELGTSDALQVFELFRSGAISAEIEYQNLLDLLKSDEEPTTIVGWMDRLRTQTHQLSTLREDVNTFLSSLLSNWASQDYDVEKMVNETFSYLPENVRNAIIQAGEVIDEEGTGLVDGVEKVVDSMSSAIKDSANQIAELQIKEWFPDVDVEGMADEWGEIQSLFDSVADSYERLASAQEEQEKMGKLSVSTVLDLLATDANYVRALEAGENGIRLRTDAEQIMNQVRIETIRTQLEVANMQDEETIRELENQRAKLESAKIGDTLITKMSDEARNLATLAQAYANATDYILAYNLAREGGSSEEVAAQQAAKTGNDIDPTDFGEGSFVLNSEKDREAAIAAIDQQMEDLKSAIAIRRSLIDDYLKPLEEQGYSYDAWDAIYDFSDEMEDATEEELDEYLNLLKKYRSLIDKEWEAMLAFDENTFTYDRTEYFDKMKKALEAEITEIQRILEKNPDMALEEQLDYEADLIELQRDLNNLDDEELEDRISLLETQDASVQALIAAQKELIETSDTEEDLIERQKELNDLLWEERDLRREIREYERDILDYALEDQSGTAYSDAGTYDRLIEMKMDSLRDDASQLLSDIETAKQEAYQQYINEGIYTESQAWALAEKSERVRDLTLEYMETVQEQGEVMVDSVNAKIDEISQMIEDLEMQKPDEWTSIGQIRSYAAETIGLLEQKLPILQEALEDTSMMTDDQVRDLVNQINEVTQALYDAQVQMHQDIQDYQENVYDAIVNTVTRYKEEIEEARDDLMDSYDEEIDKLNDINDERQDAIDLEEVLQNLEDARNEKQRVKYMPFTKMAISVKIQRWTRLRKDYVK